MAVKRRMGPENAATCTLLMDAVESLMREQGYAALSARKVAARAGLKYQIVFYYFETMDDLLLAAYRRRTQNVLERTQIALASGRPFHALWEETSDPFDAALSIEYMAMSNHNPIIRAETMEFGERIRRVVLDGLSERLRDSGVDPKLFPPFGVTLGLSLVGGILGFESALGLSGGHAELRFIVERFLARLEPAGAPARGSEAPNKNLPAS
jgi:AcrR family transcriptional regulator